MHQPIIPIALPARTPLPDNAPVLAADVGGTKTDLALFEMRDGELFPLQETVYPTRNFPSFAALVRQFLNGQAAPKRLCIAFAGPVFDGRARATNLDWEIDTAELSRDLAIPEVTLLNDLEAEAYGLAALNGPDMIRVYAGENAPSGNVAIIAPGTGLGEAGLFWDGNTLHPFATEGGHCAFAPHSEFDWGLFRHIQKMHGRVSWERVLSGPGIFEIYRFLRDEHEWEEPEGMREKMVALDPSAAIGLAAQEQCPICVETLRIFVRYLATEASNLVLKLNARGGLFIGGGIVPKIWNEDLKAIFLDHFFAVGRLRPLLELTPVHLVLNQKTALLGAAYYGRF